MSKNEVWEQMGEQLRGYRKQRGLSTHKAARLIGISGNYISQIERGIKAPSAAIIAALGGFYDIDAQPMYKAYNKQEIKYAQDIKKLPTSIRGIITRLSKDDTLTENDLIQAIAFIKQIQHDRFYV